MHCLDESMGKYDLNLQSCLTSGEILPLEIHVEQNTESKCVNIGYSSGQYVIPIVIEIAVSVQAL